LITVKLNVGRISLCVSTKCCLHNFEVEIGGMDFEINGILGMDFLIRAKAIINI